MVRFHSSLYAFTVLLTGICSVISQSSLPPNDQCENAVFISSTMSNETKSLLGTTVNASLDSPNYCGENFVNSPGVWYVIESTSSPTSVSVSTCSNTTNFDTAITIYTGESCESLQCVGGRDNDGECPSSQHSTISWTTRPGKVN